MSGRILKQLIFSIISRHRYDKSNRNLSSSETGKYVSYFINSMAIHGLASQGAMASVIMWYIYVSQNIPVFVPEGLNSVCFLACIQVCFLCTRNYISAPSTFPSDLGGNNQILFLMIPRLTTCTFVNKRLIPVSHYYLLIYFINTTCVNNASILKFVSVRDNMRNARVIGKYSPGLLGGW